MQCKSLWIKASAKCINVNVINVSLRMTRLWWVSLATEMRQTTGARWAAWPGGAVTTISLWMWRRRRRLLLTSGECTLCMLLWPSTVRLWRVSSTKFLGVHITEDLSWTNNTAALAKKAQQRLYFLRKLRRARAPVPSCAPSTEAPSRASWLAASLCGMALAMHPAARPFNA